MNSSSPSNAVLQKNIYGLIFLLYSVTYIANHATAIFDLQGAPKQILHYSGEVILLVCAVGYGVSNLMVSSDKGRVPGFFSRVPIIYWLGCCGVALNAIFLLVSIVTGRSEK